MVRVRVRVTVRYLVVHSRVRIWYSVVNSLKLVAIHFFRCLLQFYLVVYSFIKVVVIHYFLFLFY